MAGQHVIRQFKKAAVTPGRAVAVEQFECSFFFVVPYDNQCMPGFGSRTAPVQLGRRNYFDVNRDVHSNNGRLSVGQCGSDLVKFFLFGCVGQEQCFILKDAVGDNPAVTINYGNFIQVTLDFLIVAFAIFMIIKAMNSAKKKEEAAPAAPPKPSNEEVLLTEIRDLLKK